MKFRESEKRLPASLNELHLTSSTWPKGRLERDDFLNGDFQNILPKPGFELYFYSYSSPRADKSRKPVFPQPDQRDLWVSCDQYFWNRPILSNGHPVPQFGGVMIGLFSDGSIEVVQAEKMLSVQRAPNALQNYFPMESGLPPDALPVGEMGKKVLQKLRGY